MTAPRTLAAATAVLVGLPLGQALLERSVSLPVGPARMAVIAGCALALVPLSWAGLERLVGGPLGAGARATAAVLVPLLAVALLLVVARFGDGPFGPVPGGPFAAVASPPPADWSLAASLRYAELEVDPDRPRTLETLVLVHRGALYVAANMPEDKRWPAVVRDHGEARIRLGGEAVYATRADFVQSRAETEELLDAMAGKYGFDVSLGGDIWFFRLSPRS